MPNTFQNSLLPPVPRLHSFYLLHASSSSRQSTSISPSGTESHFKGVTPATTLLRFQLKTFPESGNLTNKGIFYSSEAQQIKNENQEIEENVKIPKPNIEIKKTVPI
ncbi:hypothetical protein TNCV_4326761 [Trichonephila clavipes]|nr:hypothetical protein TNCV_4326761 [Trichonephila clavipes]